MARFGARSAPRVILRLLYSLMGHCECGPRSIGGFVTQPVVFQPGHHTAQAHANRFNRMLKTTALQFLEKWLAGFAFGHPFVCKRARLNVLKKFLHFLAYALVDHARPAR